MPDLSFSELSFLKSKREKPNDSIRDKIEKSRPERDHDWDVGALISRYFASRKSVHQSKCLSGPEASELFGRPTLEPEYPSRGHMDRNVAPANSVNISEKPCLGFGSSKGDLTSPARNTGRKSNSQSSKPSPSRTASLVSWSVSGVPSHHDTIDRDIKKSSDAVPNVRTNVKTDRQASLTGQKPYDSVLPPRKVIHSSDKVSKFDEQQEELSRFMAENVLSENMATHCVGVPEPQANGREKRTVVEELVFSGQDSSPNQESQASFGAAENFPDDCQSTTHSPHASACLKAADTVCLPEKPNNIPDENPTLLSQRNHNIQGSTIKCVYENPEALHNDFFDPHSIPRAPSFGLRTDQPKDQLNFGLIEHGRCIPKYNHLDAYTSDHVGLDRLPIGLSNHEFYTTDASQNYEKSIQRCSQMRNLTNGGFDEHGYYQQCNGCSNCLNRLAGPENLEECTVDYNPEQFTSHELGAVGEDRDYSSYGRNDSTQFSEELFSNYNEQETESAIYEMEEPPSRFSTENETILDANARYGEPLLQENMDAAYYQVLEDSHDDFHEDSHEDLLDSELEVAGLPQDNNRNNERFPQDQYCYESFIPQYDTESDVVNNVNTHQMAAMLEPNGELVIPGFWKPQKLY